ncbi:MAG: hypothetical protein A2Y88_12080 [Chloroflexi bacterium RBG_13_48_10]|nr:MAG: hypothetical protein A2Y88_12080 [Chloroflexi bacterium RBG_13_48_10]
MPLIKLLHIVLVKEMHQCISDKTFDTDDLIIHHITDMVTKKIKEALEKIGSYSKGNVVHMLRHTTTTMIPEETGDLKTVHKIIGHSQITTTQFYPHIVSERNRKALEAFPY